MNLRIKIVFLVSFFVFIASYSQTAHAQKIEKKERKRLLSLAKRWYKDEAGLEEYKANKDKLVVDRKTFIQVSKDAQKQQEYAEKQKKELEQKQNRIEELNAEIERLKAQQQSGTYIPDQQYNPCELTAGTVYKVQILMPEQNLYTGLVDGKKQVIFNGEKEADGQYKYTVACFDNLEEAQEFNDQLNELAIKTILVTYQDGKKQN